MTTLIIAEPGSTHEGQLDRMMRLIDAAADAGADVFKNQFVSSAERLCERRHAPEYLDSYRKLQYPIEWHRICREHAIDRGMQYACSIYRPGDAALVAPFVDYLKISSFESGDRALRSEVFAEGVRVIISYGMGAPRGDPRGLALACISAYPAPIDALNLRRLVDEYGERLFDGFSDHSRDVRVGAWAVCSGAEIIEAHLRLDDTDPANKDHAVSFTPAEFAEYVRNIRDAESALGDGVNRIQDCEQPMARFKVRT